MAAGSTWAYRHIRGATYAGIEPISDDGREVVSTALTLERHDKVWSDLWDETGGASADLDLSKITDTALCRPCLLYTSPSPRD